MLKHSNMFRTLSPLQKAIYETPCCLHELSSTCKEALLCISGHVPGLLSDSILFRIEFMLYYLPFLDNLHLEPFRCPDCDKIIAGSEATEARSRDQVVRHDLFFHPICLGCDATRTEFFSQGLLGDTSSEEGSSGESHWGE